MVHVAHVCRVGVPQRGGMEVAVHGLARAMAAEGYATRVITLDRPLPSGPRHRSGVFDGVPYVRLARLGPRRYPFASGLAEALAGAQIVHVHGLDGLLDQVVRLARPDGAVVGVSTHGGYFHTRRHRWLKAAWLRTMTASSLRAADAVWFTSEADAARLAPAGVAGEVVPNGLALGALLALPRAPRPRVWVAVGRVAPHKGLDRLIAALPVLDQQVDELVIVGQVSAAERARLVRLAHHVGVARKLVWRGELSPDALHTALISAELAVFPSRAEGFGLALVEAMAAGCPVLASDIAAHRERLQGGAAGLLVDFERPAAVRDALVACPPSDRAALALRARHLAAGYDWRSVVPRWRAAYDAIVRGVCA